jgi:hypothetical protein
VTKGVIARQPTSGLYLTKEGHLRFGRWWASICDGLFSLFNLLIVLAAPLRPAAHPGRFNPWLSTALRWQR